jgi:Ca2+ transporting ATPase
MTMREFEQLKEANNDFEEDKDRDVLEQELIAVGIFGLQDPLRDTIVASVNKVKAAGIKVIMCTGDNLDTATAISKNAEIVTDADIANNPKYTCMVGQDFRDTVGVITRIPDPNDPKKMIDAVGDQGKFNRVIEHLRVLARSSPEDKYLLVTGLQATAYDPDDDDADAEA